MEAISLSRREIIASFIQIHHIFPEETQKANADRADNHTVLNNLRMLCMGEDLNYSSWPAENVFSFIRCLYHICNYEPR